MANTKITAKPNPCAVFTSFEHPKKVHSPKNIANKTLLIKIDSTAKLNNSIFNSYEFPVNLFEVYKSNSSLTFKKEPSSTSPILNFGP